MNHNYPLVPREQLNSSGPSSTGSLGSSPTVSTLAQSVNNNNVNASSVKPNKMNERTASALSDDEEIEWMKIRCNEAPSERYESPFI